ncbi:MAG: tRNA (N(6)-L-threonylcarbamoyladenosine(37)-C(2))-methylthiotransferase MtaB [Oscillospiraceae bacterium]|jgi:threonylcarbamoyladenosine tRNA methylthiotransferase MtaB|nr:tRNA (N(6)-L-threonylcarbamoyladenosine(37)-C(2))-methylthiotransferase MtaB [Oscillospiraceae bacterium]
MRSVRAMKVALYTLGCKVNQWETGALAQLLRARGHGVVPWEAPADAYVINTCTVTAVSDQKSRRMIRRTRREHPGALLCVCGCLPQSDPEATLAIADIDLLTGAGDRAGFVDRLEALHIHRIQTVAVDNAARRTQYEQLPGGVGGRTRALLKVQDGCDNRCTYCVIPSVRGPARSLPLEAAAAEAARLAGEGYRELVITGIEISSYGRDLPAGAGLAPLTEAICRAAPALRVRLGSLEPRTLDAETAARLAALPNLCPHFHVALQSGCDETLRRMGRRYDTAHYTGALARLRAALPGCAVTTDLIVGFPGETEAEFAGTLSFVEARAFSGMHIFPYSRRPGTPAADMPGQVPRAEKRRRAAVAGRLAARMGDAYRAGCVGRTVQVLFETEMDGVCTGHAENYQPVRCAAAGLRGQLRPALVTSVSDGALVGQLI